MQLKQDNVKTLIKSKSSSIAFQTNIATEQEMTTNFEETEMTNHIIPKVAYIPLEYTLSVDDFLELWNQLEDVGEPTQEDYDQWCLAGAKQYSYDMRGYIEDNIRLMEYN